MRQEKDTKIPKHHNYNIIIINYHYVLGSHLATARQQLQPVRKPQKNHCITVI